MIKYTELVCIVCFIFTRHVKIVSCKCLKRNIPPEHVDHESVFKLKACLRFSDHPCKVKLTIHTCNGKSTDIWLHLNKTAPCYYRDKYISNNRADRYSVDKITSITESCASSSTYLDSVTVTEFASKYVFECQTCRLSQTNKEELTNPITSCLYSHWGDACTESCPGYCLTTCGTDGNCKNGKCHIRYTGSRCNKTCEDNKYISYNYCDGECNCEKGDKCDIVSGTCTEGICKPGWTYDTRLYGTASTKCNRRCLAQTFGVNCSLTCHCKDKKPCNHVNGSCTNGCSAYHFGESCQETCDKQFLSEDGKECEGKCHCKDDEQCILRTKVCPSRDCEMGWMLTHDHTCQKPCGYSGPTCEQQCHCALGVECNTTTGICATGCDVRHKGHDCQRTCPNDTFGLPDCDRRCNCNNNKDCHVDTGECLDGTTCTHSHRLYGIICQNYCPEQRFLINNTCSGHCHCFNPNMCNVTNGYCHQGGCAEGYLGPKCQKHCAPGYFGRQCKKKCHCKNDDVCHHVDGFCENGCASKYEGADCQDVAGSILMHLGLWISVGVISFVLSACLGIFLYTQRDKIYDKYREAKDSLQRCCTCCKRPCCPCCKDVRCPKCQNCPKCQSCAGCCKNMRRPRCTVCSDIWTNLKRRCPCCCKPPKKKINVMMIDVNDDTYDDNTATIDISDLSDVTSYKPSDTFDATSSLDSEKLSELRLAEQKRAQKLRAKQKSEQRKAEKLEEEQRRAEEQRKAEERRIAEQQRQAELQELERQQKAEREELERQQQADREQQEQQQRTAEEERLGVQRKAEKEWEEREKEEELRKERELEAKRNTEANQLTEEQRKKRDEKASFADAIRKKRETEAGKRKSGKGKAGKKLGSGYTLPLDETESGVTVAPSDPEQASLKSVKSCLKTPDRNSVGSKKSIVWRDADGSKKLNDVKIIPKTKKKKKKKDRFDFPSLHMGFPSF